MIFENTLGMKSKNVVKSEAIRPINGNIQNKTNGTAAATAVLRVLTIINIVNDAENKLAIYPISSISK